MQVNLTETPILLEKKGFFESLSEAIKKARAYTGMELDVSYENFNSTEKIENEIAYFMHQVSNESMGSVVASIVLVSLAVNGHLMLPVSGTSVFESLPREYNFELTGLLGVLDSEVRKKNPAWILDNSHLRIILMTDYREKSSFNIHDFVCLHDFFIKYRMFGKNSSLTSPVYLTLKSIEGVDPESLGRDVRISYIIWRHSMGGRAENFEEFIANPKNMGGMRVHGNARERLETTELIERRNKLSKLRKEMRAEERGDSQYVKVLKEIAHSSSLTAPELYFASLRGGSNVKGFRPNGWLDRPTPYPGRESVDIAKVGLRWFTAFRLFLVHRSKDFESDKEVRSAICVLADYLLLYLPWWIELHPESSLKFPESPKKFYRYLFVNRTRFNEGGIARPKSLPKTINELIASRRPTATSRNKARNIYKKFFDFVMTYFEDKSGYISKGMLNPVRLNFDNEVDRRPHKTNKIPFYDDVFPFLVNYGQAVEAFGEYLQQEAYIRDVFNDHSLGGEEGYETQDWGYVPIFWYKGVVYHLDFVPNIFPVHKRTLKSNPSGEAGIYVHGIRINYGQDKIVERKIPSLTVVRLLISMVETGLRGQSIQWLDRRNFDSLANKIGSLSDLHGYPDKQSYHPLYINTDKTHNEWSSLVSWRVRRTLLAEKYFQESLFDEYSQQEAPYEGRLKSRFSSVLSLFRTVNGRAPLSDTSYSLGWVVFLYGFQIFYNKRGGKDRNGTDDAQLFLKEKEGVSERSGIARSYLAINTPHACRATYATLKDGDLELEEVAEQLGHSNTRVTNRYQVPMMKTLVTKLKANDARIMGEGAYDFGASGFLKPESQGSPVRVAFSKNREQAIADFGFVPGTALWSLSELDEESSSLDVLKQSPVSIIRWHATHVCPVGNQCPQEVVANTGGLYRCGMCPLAAKCIDHLPAIEAKQRELLERIQTATIRQAELEKRGSSQAAVDLLYRERALDTKEFLGWKLSAEILRARQRDLGEENKGYYVDQPELVRKQLERVTRSCSESEFFLQRIADSSAWPSLESPEVRAKAARYTRLILAQQGQFREAAFFDVPSHSEIMVFASLVKPFVEAKGLTMTQLGEALDAVSRAVVLPTTIKTSLLAGG